MTLRYLFSIFSINSFLPNKICYKSLTSKHFITNFSQISYLIIINRDKDHPILF